MALDYSRNPEYLAEVKEQMRPYQVMAVARALKRGRVLFDMYMGLGKTLCSIVAMFAMRPRKVLIICGQAARGTWLKEIREWFPAYAIPSEFNIIKAQGQSAAKRKKQWSVDATFYICTMQTFLLDVTDAMKNQFDLIIGDEVHKWPKHTTKTFKQLAAAVKPIPNMILQTGTWIKRHAGRGWRHLHLLAPHIFSSYYRFLNRYCITQDNGFGMEIIGPKNTEEFHHVIHDWVFRFHDIEGNIPQSVRKMIWIDRTPEQAKIYDELSENMLSMLDSGELLLSAVSISTFGKHRQLLTCPKMISDSLGYGAAYEAVEALLIAEADDPEEQHCVMFSPFRAAIPLIAKRLNALGYKTWEFMGGMNGDAVQKNSEEFCAHKGKKSVALCTIDFSESFQLGTAVRSHFLGLAFDGDVLKQAEARLARADSDLTKTIVHRYWLYNDTLHEDSVDVLRGRALHVRKLFSHVDQVRASLAAQSNKK